MKRTYYFEQDGMRVDGCATRTAARKAWEMQRNAFAKTSAECRPWVLHYAGHVLIVAPSVSGWDYTVVSPGSREGVRHAGCYFNAESQVAAIVQGVAALAQNVWSRDVLDDGAMFDALCESARLFAGDAVRERAEFVHVTAFWRSHAAAAAA